MLISPKIKTILETPPTASRVFDAFNSFVSPKHFNSLRIFTAAPRDPWPLALGGWLAAGRSS
jgi:hypothetical protein